MDKESAQALYKQIGILLSQKPPLEGRGAFGEEQFQWLSRAFVLIEQGGDPMDIGAARIAIDYLNTGARAENIERFKVILYRTLARAELLAPVSVHGAFVGTGAEFTAFQAVAKVLALAKSDILVIDPYLSVQVLFDFIPTAAEKVNVRLLSDGRARDLNSALKGGVERWKTQYGENRPLSVRYTEPRQLHDRIIIIDGEKAYILTQSLKDLAARSPATLMKADEDIASAKIEAYQGMWSTATPL